MNLTPRALLAHFTQLFQLELFPEIESSAGPLSTQAQLLVQTLALLPLDAFLPKQWYGRPREDRKAILSAFIAKAIYNIPDTRHLIRRLQQDEQLRRLCGWMSAAQVPSESTFSRAFAHFAHKQLGTRLQAALVEATQRGRLVGHIVRDSTAIEARERFPEEPANKGKQKKKPRRKPKSKRRALAKDRGTLVQRQRHQSLPEMLAGLPQQCSLGVKTNSKGHQQYWRGYKLHLDVADGQIPISAVLTSASVHDVNVAIPLMTMTAARVDYCYDVMDSAYDAQAVLDHICAAGRVPVVMPHPRRGTKKPSALPKVFPAKPTPELCPAKRERFQERTGGERVNGRLKDEFGGRFVRVRGPVKVTMHLMCGVIALTVDQWLRMAAP